MSNTNSRGLASADQDTRQQVGQKGGQAVSQDREHMAEIGSKGGESSHSGRQNDSADSGSSNRGSNLSQEDRAKGGERSHSGGRKAG